MNEIEKPIRFRTYRAVMLFYASYGIGIISVFVALSYIFTKKPYPYPVWFYPLVFLILFAFYFLETRNKLYFTKDTMYYKMDRGNIDKMLALYKKDIKYFKMITKNEILADNRLLFDNKFKEEIQSNKKSDTKYIIFFLKNGKYEWIDISMYQLDIILNIGAVLAVYWDLDEYFEEDDANE